MTIHQLYDGGPANSTLSRAQWPAYPFSASDPAFAELDISVHGGSPLAQLRRTLDFKNDYALRNYFKTNAVAAADTLNLILLPPKCLLLGLYVEVENVENAVGAALAPPAANAPSTATTGGTLVAATYFYKVTALGVSGETAGSNEVSVTTTGSTSTTTVTWAAVSGATGYRIYRGTAIGQENVYFVVGAVTTFTDTGTAGTVGSPPSSGGAVGPGPVLTMTFASAAGKTFGAAIDCTVLSANFAAPNGSWDNGTAGGAASLATAQYIGTQPDMVQAALTSMGVASLAGFGDLRLNVAATIVQLGEFKATNF